MKIKKMNILAYQPIGLFALIMASLSGQSQNSYLDTSWVVQTPEVREAI